jgi:hypothetical protein
MPWGLDPRGGGGPGPLIMVERDDFRTASAYKTVDGRFGIISFLVRKLCQREKGGDLFDRNSLGVSGRAVSDASVCVVVIVLADKNDQGWVLRP